MTSTKRTEAKVDDYKADPNDHSGMWTPTMVIDAHRSGERIPWRSCTGHTLEEVAIWADRHSADLLRKVRAAVRRRDADDRPAAPGYYR
jgi:hypothetical protein